MNKFKLLIISALLCIMVVPFTVMAEGEETTTSNEDSKKVTLYFFRGEGCSHCAEFEAWLKEIEPEYGNKINVVDYETWYNEENNELMQKVAEARNEEASGVPYIIIGEHGWNGFADEYKQEILEAIDSNYKIEPSKRFDVMKYLGKSNKKKNDDTSSSIIAIIVIILVVGGIVFGIVRARKRTY